MDYTQRNKSVIAYSILEGQELNLNLKGKRVSLVNTGKFTILEEGILVTINRMQELLNEINEQVNRDNLLVEESFFNIIFPPNRVRTDIVMEHYADLYDALYCSFLSKISNFIKIEDMVISNLKYISVDGIRISEYWNPKILYLYLKGGYYIGANYKRRSV